VTEVRGSDARFELRLGALLAGACFRVWNCWWFHQVESHESDSSRAKIIAGMIDREKVTGGPTVDDRFGGRGWGSIRGEKGRFIAITRVRDRVSLKPFLVLACTSSIAPNRQFLGLLAWLPPIVLARVASLQCPGAGLRQLPLLCVSPTL
jgi:hypothetical protein